MAIAVIISGFGALDRQANRRDHLVESARDSRGGVLAEVMIGIALLLLWLVAVTTPSRYAVLGREPGTHVYRDISKHPDDEQPPDIAVVRLDGDLLRHGRCTRGPNLRCRPLIERAPWDGARLRRHQRRRLSATGSSSNISTSHPVSCASHHLSAARKAGKCGGHPTSRLVGNTIAS